jgi:hypothetical protein
VKKILLIIVSVLAFAGLAFSQGGIINGIALTSTGAPSGGASIRVCTSVATGTPCSPVASIYSNAALTITKGSGGVFAADANANYWFYAAPGFYQIQVTVGTSTYTLMDQIANPDESKINDINFAGPVTLPTIDQACPSAPCVGMITRTYSDAESANLITTTDGYKVYSGPNNLTLIDLRANAATPLTPTAAPLYPILFGGREEGQETRIGCNYWADSPDDSVACSSNFTWPTGAYPSNNGTINGTVSAVIAQGAVTVGASSSALVANDGEVYLSSISADHSAPRLAAFSGQLGIRRARGVQGAKTSSVFWAHSCINSSTSGAILVDCYGVDAQGSSAAVGRNFAYHSSGNWLTENGTAWYANKLGTVFTVFTATESSQTVTITTSAPCNLTTNQHVTVAGVTNTSYNGDFIVLTPGCNGGSTFTYTNFGTNNLASSSGGTATGATPQLVSQWSGSDVVYKPLADANGWTWQTQAGGSLFKVTSSTITVGTNQITPVSAGNAYLGSAPLPFAGLIVTRCTSSASPAVCGASVTGFVNIAASATTVVVNTTAVTATSSIGIHFDESLGTALGVTCNTASGSEGATYFVSARSPGTSFTITTNVAPTTNPVCLSFTFVD